MNSTAKYVTVLDFGTGEVSQYPIAVSSMFSDELETKLKELGHNLKNCEWMVHKGEPIIH